MAVMENKGVGHQNMFLHIGEGLMVKKSDVVAILDARKIMDDDKNQSFFEGLLGEKLNIGNQVKSFILVKEGPVDSSMLLMSGIASTTLQKRFHGNIEEMMEIEAREMNGKPTKQL